MISLVAVLFTCMAVEAGKEKNPGKKGKSRNGKQKGQSEEAKKKGRSEKKEVRKTAKEAGEKQGGEQKSRWKFWKEPPLLRSI